LKQILFVIAASRRSVRQVKIKKSQKGKIPGAGIFSRFRVSSQANYG
jgi:hypothetical protein